MDENTLTLIGITLAITFLLTLYCTYKVSSIQQQKGPTGPTGATGATGRTGSSATGGTGGGGGSTSAVIKSIRSGVSQAQDVTEKTVVFDPAFEAGVVPIVVMTPKYDATWTNPSAWITKVSNTSFSYAMRTSAGDFIKNADLHWIAIEL